MTNSLLGLRDSEASTTSISQVALLDVEVDISPDVPLYIVGEIGLLPRIGGAQVVIVLNDEVFPFSHTHLQEPGTIECAIPAYNEQRPYRPSGHIKKVTLMGNVDNPQTTLFAHNLAVYKISPENFPEVQKRVLAKQYPELIVSAEVDGGPAYKH